MAEHGAVIANIGDVLNRAGSRLTRTIGFYMPAGGSLSVQARDESIVGFVSNELSNGTALNTDGMSWTAMTSGNARTLSNVIAMLPSGSNQVVIGLNYKLHPNDVFYIVGSIAGGSYGHVILASDIAQ
jgi:hypothetical protein